MPETCDVAVVGGGLVGTAVAYELVTAGVDAVLVDRADPGRATDAGAGILSAETNRNPDDEWFAFALAAAAHYRQLVAALSDDGATDTGYDACGLLCVALAEHEDEWFAATAAQAMRRSPGVVAEVTPAEASERFPPLRSVWRALYSPAAARVDGRRMSAALRSVAERRGLRARSGSVSGIERRGGRVTGVRTDDGLLGCGAVVVAGGAWSARLGDDLGVTLPVVPLKGQIVHLVLDGADSSGWPIVQPVLNHYLVAWPGGRVACGGTLEPDAGFDRAVTAQGLGELLRECLVIAPGLGLATVAEVRVGLRPATTDGDPVLGPLPGWENAFVCTGHGTEGLLLGPLSAALVARAVRGEHDPVLDRFGAGRFGA
ncbi:MAG TPA: FAD-dependent oxidoreductase [Acidimicrobiales bacterium]|nr:FAD-dependent oxidoreductase [Acidimicrobiales bacterium]